MKVWNLHTDFQTIYIDTIAYAKARLRRWTTSSGGSKAIVRFTALSA